MPEAFIYDHVRTPRGRGKPTARSTRCRPSNSRRRRCVRCATATGSTPASSTTSCSAASTRSARPAATSPALRCFAADYGVHVPGMQINRFCASGLDAVNVAAGQVLAGQHDMVVAGGVESMSRVGIGASGGAWPMDPDVAVPSYFMPQGVSADLIATKYGFTRDDVDAYAVESQKRAASSWAAGAFDRSVVPVRDVNGVTILARDEHMRPGTDMQSLGALKASFVLMGEMGGFDAVAVQAHPDVEKVEHVHHAGNSSGIVDGAAAVLVGSAEAGRAAGLKPRGRIRAFANIGSDPALMLTGPIDVTEKVLKRSGMTLGDIDLFEINEAFAAVVLRYRQAFDLDAAKVNVAGGAIALGHPSAPPAR